MGEACPGHVGDVEKAVDTIEIEECPEVSDVLDGSFDLVSGTDGAEELLATLAAFRFDEFTAAEDDILAVLVEFHDLEVVDVADKLLEILRRIDIHLGSGKEGLHAHIDRKATFDDRFDTALDDAFGFEKFDDFFPVLALSGLELGKHDHSLVVFEAFEENLDLVPYMDFIRIIKLRSGDDAFGFVADVDEEFFGAFF
jgi:hypothetical protein